MAPTVGTGRARLRRVPPEPVSRRELRCQGCGYGIVIDVRRPRPSCPMCGDLRWLAVERLAREPERLGYY